MKKPNFLLVGLSSCATIRMESGEDFMEKVKKRKPDAYKKRQRARRKKKIFRWVLLFFIGIVCILILRVAFAKQMEPEPVVDTVQPALPRRAGSGEGTREHAPDVEGYQKELQGFMRLSRDVEMGKEPYENSEVVGNPKASMWGPTAWRTVITKCAIRSAWIYFP